ncbi:YpmS family protein [Lederbergia citrea]|uniref:YpmS family protein n=1 Tax=Lederbergia citrea TaxID=2833581 RepID=A0A942UK22_9BACI|nr:YpmS family protein [Lederbergia citrea]MBS4203204.1 YpmS family protein [Lederbergia citrea]MBS4222125.1 YpmS family protein [Lederbergia citrea]
MKNKNTWKILFIALLTINILIVVSLGTLLFLASDQERVPESNPNSKTVSEFFIRTEKDDLNKLINHYIEKEGLNGPIHYQVLLTDEVELYGEVKVFSETMQLKMTFEPIALDNGDLVLEQKTLSLGGVKLPVSYILKFIRDAYKFPEWVIIQPNDKQIYVALQKMRLNGGIRVRTEEFNLAEDRISMKMLVPVK